MALEISGSTSSHKKSSDNFSFSSLIKSLHPPITPADRMVFTERLAMLVETGNPIHTSLAILEGQISNKELAKVVAQLSEDINAGMSFARALAKHDTIFDTTYVNLVAAGEAGGFLSEVLDQLYKVDRQSTHIRSMVTQAMMYPTFLLIFSIAIVIFILVVVFPKFTDMFASIANDLPSTTIWLMAASNALSDQWRELLLALAIVLIGFSRAAQRPSIQSKLDTIKLKIPLIKDIIIQYYLVQTLRVLSMSLKNGVSILDALNGSLDIVKNHQFRKFLQTTALYVESGESLSKGFERSPIIPTLVKQMISTGEQSGKLPFVMLRISEFYEIELEKRIKMVSKLAEPIMLLIMGVFVGVLVSSLILPIFQLSRSVH